MNAPITGIFEGNILGIQPSRELLKKLSEVHGLSDIWYQACKRLESSNDVSDIFFRENIGTFNRTVFLFDSLQKREIPSAPVYGTIYECFLTDIMRIVSPENNDLAMQIKSEIDRVRDLASEHDEKRSINSIGQAVQSPLRNI